MYTYQITDIENPRRVLEGLTFIIVDLEMEDLVRKICPRQDWTVEKKRRAVLWLHFQL
jgi:hypothetical protein